MDGGSHLNGHAELAPSSWPRLMASHALNRRSDGKATKFGVVFGAPSSPRPPYMLEARQAW